MRVIGLDVGGANLKASDGERRSVSRPFAIWKHPDRLTEELQLLLGEFERPQHLAVTMTAELADCFATKAEGVDRILTAVAAAVGVPVHVWQRGGEFVSPADARDLSALVAAANWHALASWAGRMTPQGVALLIDMGSTTTDIVPLIDGLPETQGGADVERLTWGELVYLGIRRTPLCAVAPSVRFRDRDVPLAAEFFATTHDIFLILGKTPEDAASTDTADTRPATIEAARSRIARMLCCDRSEVSTDELIDVAAQLEHAVQRRLTAAVQTVLARLPQPPQTVLLSGEGEFAIRPLLPNLFDPSQTATISLTASLGETHSQSACAYALARLGQERIRTSG